MGQLHLPLHANCVCVSWVCEIVVGPKPDMPDRLLRPSKYNSQAMLQDLHTLHNFTILASFRSLRKKEHEQILINLCFALMGMYLVFILGANAASSSVLCGISAGLLQYFMLVFFSWTAVEAFYLYRKLVKVLGVKEISWLVLKIGLIVWRMLLYWMCDNCFYACGIMCNHA